MVLSSNRGALALVAGLWAAGCAGGEPPVESLESDTDLYALVETVDGAFFYPPLAPAPSPVGVFDASLLARLSVRLVSTSAAGVERTVATFDQGSSPALRLVSKHELYFVNVPAAAYFTDPSLAYRFEVLLDGRSLGFSDLSEQVFAVLARIPALQVGVKVRLEARAAPVLASIAPAFVDAGLGAQTVTLSGAHFTSDSVASAGDVALVTTRLADGRLAAIVPAELVAQPGALAISVTTPAPGGGTSDAVTLTVGCPDGQHFEANGCAANDRTCAIANGAGSESWTGAAWSACVATSCDAGYHFDAGGCAQDALPTQYNRVWHVATWGSDTTGDGSGAAPFATYAHAAGAAISGDGVRFGPGTFRLTPMTAYPGYSNAGLYDLGKSLTIFGANAATTLEFHASDAPLRDANLIQLAGANSSLSNVRLVFHPNRGTNYSNAIFTGNSGTGGTISNVVIEARGPSAVAWVYNNGETLDWPVVTNSVINGNGSWQRHYTGRILLISCLTDGDAESAGTYYGTRGRGLYTVERAVTAADLAGPASIPQDLFHTGEPSTLNPNGTRAHVGVFGGRFAWH